MNKKSVVSGIGWSFAERISAQMVSLIVSIVLARILAPKDYGVLAIVNVFVAIGDALVAGGFGIALVQKKDSTNQDFDSICWVSVLISCILYLVLFLCAPFISSFYANDDLTLITRILGIRLVFSAINSIQQAYIQKKLLFKRSCLIATLGAFISGIIGIIMALLGTGVWALVLQNLTSVIMTTIILFGAIEWRPRFQCSIESIKEMWGYGSRVFLATTVDTLKDNVRTLVVGKVFSTSDLAYYNQGKRFPQLLVNDVVNSVGKVLLPVFSEQQHDLNKNKDFMRLSIRVSSFIMLPLIFGMIGIADNFILLFLTKKWMPCVPYLRILSLVYVTRSINTILKNGLLAIGKSGINLFHEIVTSVLTIILIIIAAFYFRSVSLIAWSYVIISLVGTIIFSYFTIKNFPYTLKEITVDYLPSFLLSLVMCGFVYFFGKLPLITPVLLLLQILVGVIVYVVGAKIFNMQELTYVINYIKEKIHR